MTCEFGSANVLQAGGCSLLEPPNSHLSKLNTGLLLLLTHSMNNQKTCKEYESAIQSSFEASTETAVEFVNYLVRERHSHGAGFQLPPLGSFSRCFSPKFLLDMMDLWERGQKMDVVDKVHARIVSNALEYVNRGDN